MDSNGFCLFASTSSDKPKLQIGVQNEISTNNHHPENLPSMETTGNLQINSFAELGVDSFLVQTLTGLSMKRPTVVQAKCIPLLLDSIHTEHTVVGVAPTGSGKTAAFAVPILQNLAKDPFGIYAIILTPTRELAIQIAEQFKALSKNFPLQLSLIVGGLDSLKQSSELAQLPHVIIATPGRLADLVANQADSFPVDRNLKEIYNKKGRLAYLVLDEADRLLEDERSFGENLRIIFGALRGPRTKLAGFTATVNRAVRSFFGESNIQYCDSDGSRMGNDTSKVPEQVDQFFLVVPSQVREVTLHLLLTKDDKFLNPHNSMIIFVNKCVTCELLRQTLKLLQIKGLVALHSQQTQAARLSALSKFRSSHSRILIATDVAARGLDIPQVNIVLNYDVPCNHRDYVHRVGRTGRAGRLGMAVTLIGEMDVLLKENIEQMTKSTMQEYSQTGFTERDITDNLLLVSDAKRLASMAMRQQEDSEHQRNEKKRRAKLLKKQRPKNKQ